MNKPTSSLRAVALCAASLLLCGAAWSQEAPNTVLLAQAAPAAATPVAAKAMTPAEKDAANAKKWSIYWGWNRSNYSNSDISFSGQDHNFTLRDVAAQDHQADPTFANLFDTFLNPLNLSIPQTNMRLAYQYSDDTAIALNLDHMKYVMVQDQTAAISGQINGVAQSGNKVLTEDFLTYEHTDGLNIISIELEKQRRVDWFGANYPTKVFALGGIGIVLPKSNVTLGFAKQARNDEFHLAGYSVAAGAGFDVDLYKDLFFRTAYKFGYVDLPDVLTSARGDKASQHFTYNELLIAFGWRF